MFDGDLPDTHRAQVDIIFHLGKHRPCTIGQGRLVGDKPEKGARVQQNPHVFSPAKAASNLSGGGSKNSGGMVNSPSPLTSPITNGASDTREAALPGLHTTEQAGPHAAV